MTESFGTGSEPGPGQLPGIEGFYLLTAQGELGRYESDGRFLEEAELTGKLAGKIRVLLQRYRAGKGDDVAVGLVTPKGPDRSWRSASLVFSDNALHKFYGTSNEPGGTLTTFQHRNKIKSIFQGMEVVLDVEDAGPDLPYPRCCPVLFVPEAGSEVLCRRYGMDSVEPDRVLELLDLMSTLSVEDKRHPALSEMVTEMLRTRITPEIRSGPDLVLAADAGTPAGGPGSDPIWTADDLRQDDPWKGLPEDRNTGFEAGAPVPYWLLSRFAPFNELNDLQRRFIARGHRIRKKLAGEVLIKRGSKEDVCVYLVEGTLKLKAYDGRVMTIVGGTRRAHLPISQLRPHAYSVSAVTEVTVILVSQKMVRKVTRVTTTYKNRSGIEVTEESTLPDGVPGSLSTESNG